MAGVGEACKDWALVQNRVTAEAQGMADFGIPPQGEHVKATVTERVEQAKAEAGAKITVDWRNGQRHLDVISMPVKLLYLNPVTHRVRAQRSIDPVRNRELTDNPWGDVGQDYLAHLLSRKPSNPDQRDPDFETLVEELRASGQREPGIISPHGVLVDGNTRCVALRELGEQHILVGVLPSDTTWQDVNNVELRLQLRRDKRREYTYINRLMAIEEQLSDGHRAEDVARNFNIKPTTLQGDRWVYGLIREAIARSSHGDVSLREIDFEEHQEKLRELYREYSKLVATDRDAAEQLKESRLAAILLGNAKTTVRLVESDFHERYLESRLPAGLQSPAEAATTVAIPGLPGIAVQESSTSAKKARSLTDKLLKAKAVVASGGTVPTPEITAADRSIREAREVFDSATRLAGKNDALQKRQVAVPQRLSDASDLVQQCAAEFAEAKSKRALDEDAFDDALLELRTSLRRLAKLAARSFATPGGGVTWLLDATQDSE